MKIDRFGVSGLFCAVLLLLAGCESMPGGFSGDVAYMEQHTPVVVLERDGAAVAIAPAYQGRVMTSTVDRKRGDGFGWINRPVIEKGFLSDEEKKGQLEEHIYIFGGEERFWLGPEGGQFGFFFKPGTQFEFSDWRTPAVIDTEPFDLVKQTKDCAVFRRDCELTNYSGTTFKMGIERTVRLLDGHAVEKVLGEALPKDVRYVAYETDNRLTNRGDRPWVPETGLPSIWLLPFTTRSLSIVAVPPEPVCENLKATW